MGEKAGTWTPGALRSIVRASATELGVRNTAWQVLQELLAVVNFQTGHARIGTPKLCIKVGRCERSVKSGLQVLRDVGLIYYIGRAHRGKTALYAFRYTRKAVQDYNARRDLKRRADFTPLLVGEYVEMGCNNFQKGVQKIPERGANFAPPSPKVSNYHSRKASPNGSTVGSGAARPIGAPDDGEELRQFSRDVDNHGYARARELAEERAEQKGALRAAENA